MPAIPQRSHESDIIEFRSVPHNLEAELSVIGSMLMDNSCIDDISPLLKPEDFWRDSHQILYRRIVEIRSNGSNVDALILIDHLERSGEFAAAGRDETIRKALEETPSTANAVYYAQIVKQRSIARSLLVAAQETTSDIESNNFTADELVERAEERIFAVGEAEAIGDGSDSLAAIDEAEAIIARRAGGEVSGVSTGLPDLDDLLDGLQPGTLTIIGARPSMGKTALALNICEHVALTLRVAPLLVSLEMGAPEVALRLLQSRSGVDGYKLKKGWLMSREEEDRVESAKADFRAFRFPLDDTSTRSVSQIAASARRHKARLGIGMVIVDYLQLVDGSIRSTNRQEQVADISRRLKQLARELSVPVLALSQINRGVENREDHRPRMADLRESGAIEQDADAVVLLHRPDYYDPDDCPGIAEAIVAKNRNGATGTVKLVFQRHLARFDSLEARYDL